MKTFLVLFWFSRVVYVITSENGNWVPAACNAFTANGSDTIVCRCDEDYCDDFPPIPDKYSTSSSYIRITTDKGGQRFNVTNGTISQDCVVIGTDPIIITIQPNQTYQTILGFGAANTDAAAINLQKLSHSVQKKLIKSLFGKNGNRYRLVRYPIGGCDFSVEPYTYEPADAVNDTKLLQFNLTQYDTDFRMPVLDLIYEAIPNDVKLKLLTTMWSPPIFTKYCDCIGGQSTLITDFIPTWVNYYVKFFKTYADYGYFFDYSTISNEPSIASPWNGMLVPAEYEINLAIQLAEGLIANNISTKLVLSDDFSQYTLPRIKALNSNSTAQNHIIAVAVHPYVEDPTNVKSCDANRRILRQDFPIFVTEYCYGVDDEDATKLGIWNSAYAYGNIIMEILNRCNAEVFIDWNIALDINGGPNWANNDVHSPIVVDGKNQVFYKQPTYYTIGHFSKFVEHGSKRIEATADPDWVGKVFAAVTPSNKQVVIVFNANDNSTDARIVTPNGCIDLTLTPQSIQTIIFSI